MTQEAISLFYFILFQLNIWTSEQEMWQTLDSLDQQLSLLYRNMGQADNSRPNVDKVKKALHGTIHAMEMAYAMAPLARFMFRLTLKMRKKTKSPWFPALLITGDARTESALYKKKVAEYVKKYATEDALRETGDQEESDSSESSMSDFSEDEAKDMEL